MKPKISVLIPACNVEPWIGRTLDSVLSQTYENLEVIAVNDGSTDGTGGILDAYAARDPRVTVIHQVNGGQNAARERGLASATGAYVTFVDGDDTLEPDLYERLMGNMLQYGAEISHCGMVFDYPDGRSEAHHGTGILLVQDQTEGLRELLAGERVEPSLCCKLYAAHLMPRSCPDTSLRSNEDLLWNFSLFSRAERSVFEDFCGYHYHQRPGSVSRDEEKLLQNAAHMLRARALILENCGERLRPAAMRLWLSAHVDVLNRSCANKSPEVRDFSDMCRKTLKRERKNIRFLIPRQRIAAYLLLFAPRLHRIIYPIYRSRS